MDLSAAAHNPFDITPQSDYANPQTILEERKALLKVQAQITVKIIIMEDIYIVPYHVHSMLKLDKALLILLLQKACVFLRIYSFSISNLEYTIPLAVNYTLSVLSCTIQVPIMPGTQFNHLGGVKCVARVSNLL